MSHTARICALLACICLSAAACSKAAVSMSSAPLQVVASPAVPDPAAQTSQVICPTPGGPLNEICAINPTQPAGGALQAGPSSTISPAAPPQTPLPSPTPSTTPYPTPTPCAVAACSYSGAFLFTRPIAPPGRDNVDFSYRFGSTQQQRREPHHGVEFLNQQGTPILAAANGVVVVAGDDRKTWYGPYSYFYGNLVIIQHSPPQALAFIPQPVYTLYGHLSKINVQVGQTVKAGQEIGQVGMTGIATGSHLHFEVRLGGITYKDSRNPELWLSPHTDASGQAGGALAGRIIDARGNYLSVDNIVIQHLANSDKTPDAEYYVRTYEEKALVGQSPWQENFAVGDLPAGWYRISFAQSGLQEQRVQVLPGQLTLVTFRIGDQ
jgi:murein DD-endopeptidase MepM/ murein hydrolase activator NlpD